MNTGSICAVLVQEHRELARCLEGIARGGPRWDNDRRTAHRRSAADLAAHLVVEDVLVQPIIEDVLERAELTDERRADIAIIVNHVVRAGEQASPERFRTLLRDGLRDFISHSERTEIGILTFAYRRFHRRDQFALADVYRQTQARLVERCMESNHFRPEGPGGPGAALLGDLWEQAGALLQPWLPSSAPAGPRATAVDVHGAAANGWSRSADEVDSATAAHG